MTEKEWLESSDPRAMLKFITRSSPWTWLIDPFGGKKISDPTGRKLRMFGVALWEAWRRRGYIHDEDQLRETAEENFAFIDDGYKPEGKEGWNLHIQSPEAFANGAIDHYTKLGIKGRSIVTPAVRDANRQRIPAATAADILRDIVHHPHAEPDMRGRLPGGKGSGVVWNPWLQNPNVQMLAESAYRERTADGTLNPVTLLALADALEESDFGDRPLLEHLRGRRRVWDAGLNEWRFADGPSPHYRGCWAVDLIRGVQ